MGDVEGDESRLGSTPVFAVAWNGSGTKLATVSVSCISGADNDRWVAYLHIVNAADGKFEHEVVLDQALRDDYRTDYLDDGFRDMLLGWSPSEKRIAASCNRHVYLVDAVRGVVERKVKNEMGVRCAAWNRAWTKLATSSFPFESYPRICIEDMV